MLSQSHTPDPLSEVLALLKPHNTMCGGVDFGGSWALEYPPSEGIKVYAVVSGACWLIVEGEPNPIPVLAGDCFLLLGKVQFRLASDLDVKPVDIFAVIDGPLNGAVATYQGGGGCFGIAAFFTLNPTYEQILLRDLPPVVHIRRESDKAALRWAIERMMQELRDPQPGGSLLTQQLASIILIQALRLHLAERSNAGIGWLFALADRQLTAAITAMHSDPACAWTLQKLAERAGMSRSVFALRFKQTVGASPMEYLTRWRMLVAADRIANRADPISAIAQSLGYDSESAFSAAFKRVMACSPRRYRPTATMRGARSVAQPANASPPFALTPVQPLESPGAPPLA